MIQELLGRAAMDQLKSVNDGNPASLPMLLHPIVSNLSPTSSSSTSSRSSAQQPQRSTSATSSPQGQGQAAEQAPLRCPRCNSSNTKFCYYNNYNLTQPRHFCKTCRRYWTKGGALRNVPIGGGCRKPRPMPTPVAKPAVSCKSLGAAPPLGLGVGVGVGMGAGPVPWATPQQSAAAQLMALLNSTRGWQGHGGGNVHRLLGLDAMGHLPPLQVLQGAGNTGGAPPSLWPQAAPRPVPTPPHMESQLGMGPLGHHDVLSGLGLKLPPPSSSPAATYYNDQLHAVVSSAGRPHEYDTSAATPQLPCSTTTVTSLPPVVSSVSAALSSATVGLDLPPVSLAAPEMQYWSGPAAMSMAWPDLPTTNGAFP